MNLKEVVKTGQPQKPPRLVIIGEEGVGKSTLTSQMPAPILVTAEDGLVGPTFTNTPNYTPGSWKECLDFIDTLTTSEHTFKTLAIDTIDWLEPLMVDYVCKRDKKKDIEDYGYGKGYTIAALEWRGFLAKLDMLRNTKKMMIVLNSHCQIKSFANPIGDNYDRYEMRTSKQVSALSREWADAVMFARFATYVEKDDNGKAKGVGGSERVIQTQECAAWTAKNRYSMPPQIELSWQAIKDSIRNAYAKEKEAEK